MNEGIRQRSQSTLREKEDLQDVRSQNNCEDGKYGKG